MRLLIVDSDHRTTECITRLFQHERRWTVVWVALPRDGMIKQHRSQYDLVIFELAPPFSTAMAGIQQLCNDSAGTPVLGLVASADKTLVAEILDAGADDCLIMPFYAEELVARADALLRRH